MTINKIKNDENLIPNFFYGTAWKKDKTAYLTELAVKNGFVAIDTANQIVHYNEKEVGDALSKIYSKDLIKRESLFLQTKYTYAKHHDHNKPYDENASIGEQVHQSFLSSLSHLHTDYIDSYIMHGPYLPEGIHDYDLECWQAMEELYRLEKIRYLGVSNFSISQLEQLYNKAKIKPKFIQNRCSAENNWDREIRIFCQKNDITYQGFSLLTKNKAYIVNEKIKDIAKELNKPIIN